jgi:type I restriction enzyme S subunit
MRENLKFIWAMDLPQNWTITRLQNLAEKITKGTTPTTLGYSYQTHGVNFVKIESLTESGKFIHSLFAHINEECDNIISRSSLKEGDILFSIAGALGRVAIVKKEILPANTNQALAIIRLIDKRLGNYLFHVLKSDIIKDKIKKIQVSTAQANLSLADINNLQVPLPPLPEQQKIAEILSTVDEKIEVIEAQINQTTELKKGLMQQLLTKGIGHTKFKDSPLGKIPESWEVVNPLQLEIDLVDGDRGTNYPQQSDMNETGFCLFLSAKNVTKNGFKFDECQFITEKKDRELRKGKLIENDIVLTTRGTIGNIALYDRNIKFKHIRLNSGMVIIRDKKNYYNKEYLFQYLKSDLFQKQINTISFGSAQPQLTIKELKKIKLIMLEIKEQDTIAFIFNQYDNKIELLKEKYKNYSILKKGLMQQLLTGKLRVNLNPTNHAPKSGDLQAAK